MMFRLGLLSLLAISLLTSPARATIHIIQPDSGPTLEMAINTAAYGDTIEFLDGVYTGEGYYEQQCQGKALLLRSQSGDPSACVIDLQGSEGTPRRAFVFPEADGGNELNGITIANGYRTGSYPGGYGGAIIILGSAQEIVNCRFTGNYASNTGGAIYSVSSTTHYVDCEFTDNSTGSAAGAMGLWGGTELVENCLFEGNSAPSGGALMSTTSHATILGCSFFGNNTLGGDGGAVYNGQNSGMTIDGCTFWNNSTNFVGGAIYCAATPDPIIVTGCTIVANTAGYGGGGIGCNNATVTIENSIIAFSVDGEAVYCGEGATGTAVCTDIFGNAGGDWTGCLAGQGDLNGNLSVDPLFCDAAGDDFTLAANSPCLPANNSCSALMGAHGEGCPAVAVPDGEAPTHLMLAQNHPNPFNPETRIGFTLPARATVRLEILDPSGRILRTLLENRTREAGPHEVVWDGRDDGGTFLPSGIYLYRMEAAGHIETRKMTLIK